jgi:hypothetical protein
MLMFQRGNIRQVWQEKTYCFPVHGGRKQTVLIIAQAWMQNNDEENQLHAQPGPN